MVQWSFRTPGRMGPLANQADIVVMGASIGGDCGVPGGCYPRKFWDSICNSLQYGAGSAGKWFAMPSIMRSSTL